MKKYFLDTNIFIYFMQDAPEIISFFKELKNGETINYYSFITRLELLGIPNVTEEITEKTENLLNEFYRIDYNLTIEEHLLDIRKKKRIKIPDAIIAASALYTNSILVTRNKDDFKRISGLKTRNPFKE